MEKNRLEAFSDGVIVLAVAISVRHRLSGQEPFRADTSRNLWFSNVGGGHAYYFYNAPSSPSKALLKGNCGKAVYTGGTRLEPM